MRIEGPTGEVVFESHPGAQTVFCDYSGRTALFGGAAGGGKSQTLLFYPFRQIKNEEKRIKANEITASIGKAIFFRRTMPEVQEMIDRSRMLFPLVDPGAKWHEQPKTWTFSCGYKYKFGQMEESKDWLKYFGTQYTAIMFDELITFDEQQFDMLDTRLRSPDPVLASMLWMRAGTNPPINDPKLPPPVGFQWVKKRFIDVAPANQEITKQTTVSVTKNGKKTTEVVERKQIFISAKLSDNPSLDEADYAATLSDKSLAVRKALLEGIWGDMTGGLLGDRWDPKVHIVKPYRVAASRNKFRSICFTYTHTMVHWWAVDYRGNLSCYRELSLRAHTAEMVANRIREIEEEAGDEWFEGKQHSKLLGPLGPPAAWAKKSQVGPSAAEVMGNAGINVSPCDDNLATAVDQIRNRLILRSKHPTEVEADGSPAYTIAGIRFFRTCKDSIESIPTLATMKNDPDLPDDKSDTVAYRSVAYAVMSRPLVPVRDVPRDDDWDLAPKPKTTRVSRSGLPGGW